MKTLNLILQALGLNIVINHDFASLQEQGLDVRNIKFFLDKKFRGVNLYNNLASCSNINEAMEFEQSYIRQLIFDIEYTWFLVYKVLYVVCLLISLYFAINVELWYTVLFIFLSSSFNRHANDKFGYMHLFSFLPEMNRNSYLDGTITMETNATRLESDKQDILTLRSKFNLNCTIFIDIVKNIFFIGEIESLLMKLRR
jgi:hypothetical protein